MGIYIRPDSPFWWMLLEGHGRMKASTGIRHDASAPAIRKALRAQAEEVYHARMVQLARGKVGLPTVTGQTFEQFAEWYTRHRLEKQKSAPRGRVILAHLRAHFGAMPIGEIRPARWTEYETARLAAGVGQNTVGRELALMKSVLAAAVGDHLEVSPLAHVRRKTVALPAKRTMTKADEVALLAELHDDEARDLYLVGVGTLLRQMNLVNLQRREHHGKRLVVKTKTGPHTVPLDGPTTLQRRAAAVLRRRMPAARDGYFFPRWQARFAESREAGNAFLLKIVRRAVLRAGLRWGLHEHGLVWHTMTRASGATRMLREHGLDIRSVQVIGGWRSLDQMAAYLGVDLSAATVPSRKQRSA